MTKYAIYDRACDLMLSNVFNSFDEARAYAAHDRNLVVVEIAIP